MQKWHCETSVHGHCIVDRSVQVWTSQNRCELLFFINHDSHALQIWPTPKHACSFLTVSPTLRNGGITASSRFSWRKVWTGVKCNFSSPHHHVRKVVGKLSVRRVGMWNFTRIWPKTKKLWVSIVPARTLSEHSGLGPPQKVGTATFLGRNSTSRTALESFLSQTLKYAVSAGLPKR